MIDLHLPWLELLVLTAILGAVVVRGIRDQERARAAAIVLQTVMLACALGVWADFVGLRAPEGHDRWELSRFVFGEDLLIIDKLTAPLIPLTALIYLLTSIVTVRSKLARFSFSRTLLMQGLMFAALSFKEPWLVIVFVIASAIPPGLELRARGKSARVYTIHMLAMALFLTAGQAIASIEGRDGVLSPWAAGCLAIGVFLRAGVFPFHCWMPDLFEKATFGTAILTALSMVGAYAALRLLLPMAPDWTIWMIGLMAVFTAAYSAGMALVQTEARRFFCYLFLSSSALILAGLESRSTTGLTGGLCVWLSVVLALGGLGLTLRAMEARAGRLSLRDYHGLYGQTPVLASFFLVTGLASVGFPGTLGFLASEMLLDGTVGAYPIAGIGVLLAGALNGIAILKVFFLIYGGRRSPTSVALGARKREWFAAMVLTLLLIGGAVVPQYVIASRRDAAEELLSLREQRTQHTASLSWAWLHRMDTEALESVGSSMAVMAPK